MVNDHRTAFALVLLGAAVSSATYLVIRLIPGVDLPNHLAVATIIRYAGNAGNSFSEYFHIEAFLRPCVLHPSFCSLSVWPSVEFANCLLLAAYAFTLPVMTFLIIRRVNGALWMALLSLLLIHNFNMSWGFVGFTLALPVVLLVVHQLLGYMETPTWRRAGVVSALCIGLYTVHVLPLLFVHLLIVVTALVVFRTDWRRIAQSILIVVPSALLVLWWWAQQPTYGNSTADYLITYYSGPFLDFLLQRPFEWLTFDNYFLFAGDTGVTVAMIFSIVILLAAVWAVVSGWKKRKATITTTHARVLICFLAISVACFLLLPHKLPGEPYIYQRFSSLIWLALIVVAAYRGGPRLPTALRTGVAVTALASVVLWAAYMRDFNRSTQSFTPGVFETIDPKRPVAAMIFDDVFRGQPLYMQFPNYHIIWNQGIITTSIIDYRFGLIRRKVPRDALPIFNPVVGRFPHTFDPRSINAPYIITRGDTPPTLRDDLDNFSEIDHQGEWAVYDRSP